MFTKKLALSTEGERLLGAVFVGDTTQFEALVAASTQAGPLSSTPEELLFASESQSAAITKSKASYRSS